MEERESVMVVEMEVDVDRNIRVAEKVGEKPEEVEGEKYGYGGLHCAFPVEGAQTQ